MRLAMLVVLASAGAAAAGGQGAESQNGTAPAAKADPALQAAADEIGRSLILRCLCTEDTLRFDATGALEGGQAKTTDWTLAGVNVLKVERKGLDAIELDGVRVVARFATDRREFDRHPQNTEAMKITIEDKGDAGTFRRALAMVFAQGIDRALEESLPAYWRHYFNPALAWPGDALSRVSVYTASGSSATDVNAPVPTSRARAGYTAAAARDRVQGDVVLRMVVDATGAPERIAVAQPLGYGLDAEAVRSAAKYRFAPGTKDGEPVACNVLLREQFAVVTTPVL
jgi:TonB family protein